VISTFYFTQDSTTININFNSVICRI
jgi:hypothetical protein